MDRVIIATGNGAAFIKAMRGITPEQEASEAEIKRLFLSDDIEDKAEAIRRSIELYIGKPLNREPLSELRRTGTGYWL